MVPITAALCPKRLTLFGLRKYCSSVGSARVYLQPVLLHLHGTILIWFSFLESTRLSPSDFPDMALAIAAWTLPACIRCASTDSCLGYLLFRSVLYFYDFISYSSLYLDRIGVYVYCWPDATGYTITVFSALDLLLRWKWPYRLWFGIMIKLMSLPTLLFIVDGWFVGLILLIGGRTRVSSFGFSI